MEDNIILASIIKNKNASLDDPSSCSCPDATLLNNNDESFRTPLINQAEKNTLISRVMTPDFIDTTHVTTTTSEVETEMLNQIMGNVISETHKRLSETEPSEFCLSEDTNVSTIPSEIETETDTKIKDSSILKSFEKNSETEPSEFCLPEKNISKVTSGVETASDTSVMGNIISESPKKLSETKLSEFCLSENKNVSTVTSLVEAGTDTQKMDSRILESLNKLSEEQPSEVYLSEDLNDCSNNGGGHLTSVLSSNNYPFRSEESRYCNILEFCSTPLESISEVTDTADIENSQQDNSQYIEQHKSIKAESVNVIEALKTTICESGDTQMKVLSTIPANIAFKNTEMFHKSLSNTLSSTSSCINDESTASEISDSVAHTSDYESKSEETTSEKLEEEDSSDWDPLTMYLFEDEESLWEDFGAYLSALPPRCLSESDSLSFDIPEDLLDLPDEKDSDDTSSTRRPPNYLTRKQWQSCFDLFLNRNRPQLYKVTSKMLFKRQASFADKNSEILKSLQERLLRLRSLSEMDSTIDLPLPKGF